MVYRGLVFGMGLAWGVLAAVFLLDLLVARRAWCGHLCPVGAFYGLLGKGALVRVAAVRREQCEDCLDCFAVCPEHQVIKPAIKGADQGQGPVILSTLPQACACGSGFSREAPRSEGATGQTLPQTQQPLPPPLKPHLPHRLQGRFAAKVRSHRAGWAEARSHKAAALKRAQ
jgi:hypothetical protein